MSCSHSLKPGPCSQCIADAPVQRVEQSGPNLLVGGEVKRAIEPDKDPHIQQPRRQKRARRK